MINAQTNTINEWLIEPDPIRYSFNTPGWYAAALLLLILAVLWCCYLLWRYHRNRYRREAIQQLNVISSGSDSLQEKASAINRLLKMVAFHFTDRSIVASLTSNSWFKFLLDTSHPNGFKEEEFGIVQKGQYDPQLLTEDIINSYTQQAKKWINTHKPRRLNNNKSS